MRTFAYSAILSLNYYFALGLFSGSATTLLRTRRSCSMCLSSNSEQEKKAPRSLLLPPRFMEKILLPLDSPFIVTKTGPPLAMELDNTNLLKIICERCTDEQVNWLVWKCLGYRYDQAANTWCSNEVFPRWRENYQDPPDLIGLTRIYAREVDDSVLKAVRALIRTVPEEYKDGIKRHFRPLGFTGFMTDELTPNRTRRAQITNFILFYREALFGKSIEELQLVKLERQQRSQSQE